MKIETSSELLLRLKAAGFLQAQRDPYWWPSSGTERVVVGAVLTQQSKWERVERSLENLEAAGLLSLEALAQSDDKTIATLIKPSGFYNTKAKRLRALAYKILDSYGDFTSFQEGVTREWLLQQRGIGEESADAILCYACLRPVMVVDSYTARLLEALDFRFESYGQIQQWLQEGIECSSKELENYPYVGDLAKLYARFHGKIVEYCKRYMRGKKVDLKPLLEGVQ